MKRSKKCKLFNTGPLNMASHNNGISFDRWVNGVCIKCIDHSCRWYEKLKEHHAKEKEIQEEKV